MKRTEFYSGAGLCVLALATLFLVIPRQIEDVADGYVSPRLVPQLAIGLVAILAALQAFNGWRGMQSDGVMPVTRGEVAAIGKITGIFAFSLVLFLWVAPVAAAIVLITGTLLALDERRPLLIAAITGGLIFAVWLVFYRLLGTPIA